MARDLASDCWNGKDSQCRARLNEAATTAYRSLKPGRDTGTEALQKFQEVLSFIGTLQKSLIDEGDGVFGPYGLGTEYDSTDESNCSYGTLTQSAVSSFQSTCKAFALPEYSAGTVRMICDGLAGMQTLDMMDHIMLLAAQGASAIAGSAAGEAGGAGDS